MRSTNRIMVDCQPRFAWLLVLLIAWTPGNVRVDAWEDESSFAHRPPADGWIGTASCSSMACHGDDGPLGSRGAEYSTWTQADPHSNAYQVLFSERSQRMAALLFSGKSRAHESSLCLSCHASAGGMEVHHGSSDFDSVVASRSFGVGCESCHGPAADWIEPHATDGWKASSPEEKELRGFRNLRSPVVAVATCAACHVGVGQQQVDHDLIAAGHPRLIFDYFSFVNVSPMVDNSSVRGRWHWAHAKANQARTSEPRDEEILRQWILGRVATSIAAVELTEHRLSDAKDSPEKVWPELAEFDCRNCHHDLGPRSADAPINFSAAGGLGILRRSRWYDAGLPAIAELLPEPVTKEALDHWQALSGNAADWSDRRGEILARLALLKQTLRNDWLAPLAAADIDRAWSASLHAALLEEPAPATWDEAVPIYVGLVAIDPARRVFVGPNANRDRLAQFPELLRYGRGFDAPTRFRPDRFQALLLNLDR